MLGKVFIIFMLQGMLSGNAVTFQILDVLTISYIKNSLNFYDDCIKYLKDVGNLISRMVACKALKWSTNDNPPISFSDMNDIDYLVTTNPHDPDYCNKENLTKNLVQCNDTKHNPYRYTKIPSSINPSRNPITYKYESANIYTENPIFIGVFPQTCLYVDGKMFSKQEQTDLGQFILYGGHQSDPSKLSKDGHGKIAPS
ncbi:11261_t:CDS:2, partial [Dentiscutata heterogama]